MDGAATLVPEIKVAGYTLRPWSIRQIAMCGPAIGAIIGNARRMKVDLGPIIRGDKKTDVDELALAELLTTSLPQILTIVAITLRVEEEALDSMDPDAAIPVFRAIFQQNAEHIKNSFARLVRAKDETGPAT